MLVWMAASDEAALEDDGGYDTRRFKKWSVATTALRSHSKAHIVADSYYSRIPVRSIEIARL